MEDAEWIGGEWPTPKPATTAENDALMAHLCCIQTKK